MNLGKISATNVESWKRISYVGEYQERFSHGAVILKPALFGDPNRHHQWACLPKREMNSDRVRPPASANFVIDASSRKSLAPILTI